MIEITPSQAAIFGIAFTIAGALIGALASVYAARLAAEKQQLYVESARFIEAFVHEIIGLRKASSDAYKIVDDAAIEKHHKAKVRFEPWVKESQIHSFHEKWQAYAQSPKTSAPGNIENRKSECSKVLAQIEGLLSYARTKG